MPIDWDRNTQNYDDYYLNQDEEGNMRISDIKVGERHRKDLGDIASLARSIAEVGLLQPIVIRLDGRLVAGVRRLEACKLLEWDDVPVHVVQTVDEELAALKAERDENTCRKDFAPSEAVAIGLDIEPMEREAAQRRRATSNAERVKFTPSETGKALDRVAAAVGMSRPTYAKAKQVVEAAEQEPEQYGDLLAQMDNTGKVDRAYKEYTKRQRAKLPKPEMPQGKYAVVYADPPWSYSNTGFDQSAGAQYPTMELLEICQLPVPDLCTDATVLFLWATSPLLPEAIAVIDAWGFSYKASMVWNKQKAPGMGWFVRTQHEFLLIATREGNTHPMRKPDSVYEESSGRHSAKPAAFYELIESMYAGPYCELFARNTKPGWDSWGNELER